MNLYIKKNYDKLAREFLELFILLCYYYLHKNDVCRPFNKMKKKRFYAEFVFIDRKDFVLNAFTLNNFHCIELLITIYETA